ncbi:hypothetical protein OTU49_015300, partial [Cherax quadricarinatus]
GSNTLAATLSHFNLFYHFCSSFLLQSALFIAPATTGQAELLMKERFSQFAGLIDDCEFKRGEKEVTCLDLQGFWDIIYFQVEDVIRRFVNLEKVKSNGWKEDKLPPQTLTPK